MIPDTAYTVKEKTTRGGSATALGISRVASPTRKGMSFVLSFFQMIQTISLFFFQRGTPTP
jgi:hypothetical protein